MRPTRKTLAVALCWWLRPLLAACWEDLLWELLGPVLRILDWSKELLEAETVIPIAERMTKAKFKIENCPENNRAWVIKCQGIGLLNTHL